MSALMYDRGVVADRPRLSVIVPVRNEAKEIAKCLRSILADEPDGGIEVLVVDGSSNDGTQEIVRELSTSEPRVSLIENPDGYVPHAMNLGIRSTRGAYIGRIDGHCRVVPGYFAGCLERIESEPYDCVGGVLVNEGNTPTGWAVAAAMSSPLGVGGALFRTGVSRPKEVDTVAFGVYRRDVFERIGGFDEQLIRNQDDDLNLRLRLAGGKILLVPNLHIRYVVRDSIRRLARQYFQYGYWKLKVMRKHRRIASIRHVIPSLFLLFLLTMLSMGFWVQGAFLVLVVAVAAYGGCLLLEGLRLAIRRRSPWLRTALAIGAIHVSYGWGLLRAAIDTIMPHGRGTDTRHTRLSR